MTEGETGASQEDDQDRPTVSPPFDPEEFAREVLASPNGQKNDFHSRVTPQGTSRQPSPQPSSRAGLHATNRPHSGGPRGSVSDRAGPAGLLSLANARIPSSLPPRRKGDAPGAARGSSWEPKEEGGGWGDFATQPPPAPTYEHGDDPLQGLDDDQPTQPPPPIQQELIDALAQSAKPSGIRGEYDDIVDAPVPPVSPIAVEAEAEPTTREMNDRISLGDYSGALDIAEKLLAIDSSDVGVRACAETCRSVLRQMYSARLGPLDRVPVVMVPRDQFRWLSIDHRAGFVLSLIDGVSTLEMLLDVSGMPELDALRILSDLAQQRIISFR